MNWLNAYQYHRDEDKKEMFEQMKQIIPDNFTKGIFIHLLFDKTNAIKHLANICKIICDSKR